MSCSDIYVNVAAEKSSSAKPMKGEESDADLDDEDQENIYANTDSKIDSFPDISIDMLEKLIKERRDNDDDDFESEYKVPAIHFFNSLLMRSIFNCFVFIEAMFIDR